MRLWGLVARRLATRPCAVNQVCLGRKFFDFEEKTRSSIENRRLKASIVVDEEHWVTASLPGPSRCRLARRSHLPPATVQQPWIKASGRIREWREYGCFSSLRLLCGLSFLALLEKLGSFFCDSLNHWLTDGQNLTGESPLESKSCELCEIKADTWWDIKTDADNNVRRSELELYLFTSLSHFTLLGKKAEC